MFERLKGCFDVVSRAFERHKNVISCREKINSLLH